MKPKSKHTLTGNCWIVSRLCRECGTDTLCDVCHLHDEPRGSCSECARCPLCDTPPQEGA